MKRPAVFAEASALPAEDRLELAAELLASAPPVPGLLVEGTPEFRAELARRVEEVTSGKARLIPWEDVRKTPLENLAPKVQQKKKEDCAARRPHGEVRLHSSRVRVPRSRRRPAGMSKGPASAKRS